MLVYLEGTECADIDGIAAALIKHRSLKNQEVYLLDGDVVQATMFYTQDMPSDLETSEKAKRARFLMSHHDGAIVIVTNASTHTVIGLSQEKSHLVVQYGALYSGMGYPLPEYVVAIQAQKGILPVFSKRDLLLSECQAIHSSITINDKSSKWLNVDVINTGLHKTPVADIVDMIANVVFPKPEISLPLDYQKSKKV